MRKNGKRRMTLMSKKYYSMLVGGTLNMMMASLLLMSDSFIAGAFIGSDAVAGVTLVTPLYSLAVFLGSVISIGIPLLYSTEMGRFNKKRADQSFGFGLLMAVIVGITMFFLISFLGKMYLGSSSPSPQVLNQAEDYLFWMRFTFLILPLRMLIGDMVYCDGDEKLSSVSNLVQGVGNIAFSIILCPIMGVRGISLASFLFNVISLLIMLIHFMRKNNSLRVNLYFNLGIMKDVLRYSIIDASSYLFLGILTAVLNAFIGARFGPEYLILSSAIALCREFQLLFDGIGAAIGPIFSIYVGEQNHSGIRSSYDPANKTAIVEGIIVMLFMIGIASFVPGFLKVTDTELARWVVLCVRFSAIGSTFISLLYLLTSYYLVIEQIRLGLVACALRDVVFNVIFAVVLGMIFGILGMLTGLAIAPAAAYALVVIYLRLRYGKEECPLLLSKVPGEKNTYMFNLCTEPDEIIDMQGKVETLLKKYDIDKVTVGRVSLLLEEMFMLIRQMNGNKAILAECTVFLLADGIRIITKDEGVTFDMADENVSTVSLSAYTIASYLEKMNMDPRHLVTMRYNRSTFFIKFQQG